MVYIIDNHHVVSHLKWMRCWNMGTEREGGWGRFPEKKPLLVMLNSHCLCCSVRAATFVSTLISIFKNMFTLSHASPRADKKKLPRFPFLFFCHIKKWGIIYSDFLNFCCLDHYEKSHSYLGCSSQERCYYYLSSCHQALQEGSVCVSAWWEPTPHGPVFQCNSIKLQALANPRKLPSSQRSIYHHLDKKSMAHPLLYLHLPAYIHCFPLFYFGREAGYILYVSRFNHGLWLTL